MPILRKRTAEDAERTWQLSTTRDSDCKEARQVEQETAWWWVVHQAVLRAAGILDQDVALVIVPSHICICLCIVIP